MRSSVARSGILDFEKQGYPLSASVETLDGARLRALLASARDAIICISDAGLITLFNQAAERMFGYSVDEVLGEDVSMLMPAPYSAEHAGYIRRYRETGEAQAIGRVRDVAAMKRDGTVFPIELSVSEVMHNGRATYAAIIRDVSDRKEMEELLRAEHEFTDSLIDTAHVIVLVLDVDGRILRYNRHMEEITGVPFDTAKGKDWFTSFIPALDRPEIRALFARAREGLAVLGHVNPIRTAAGELREILWYATRLLDSGQKVVGVVSIGHDVTEQRIAQNRLRELEHAARQSDRLADIGAITAKIVHDLGNPLAALTMQAQLILRRARRGDFQPADVVAKPVDQMLETLERLQVLVREFTEFARERPLRILPIHVREFLQGVTEMWDAYADARGVSLRAHCSQDVAEVHADLEMLRRVLDNVIKNAVDAIDTASGAVEVHASRVDTAHMRISVTDDGCGVPEGLDVFRLFETTKPDGTGIGLAVAKQIVLAHGGEITYERRVPRGTVFHIDLPIAGPIQI